MDSAARKIAAILGALGVALGAFGAHGLSEILKANQSTQTWQTAAHYHLLHAVVLLWISSLTPVAKRSFNFLLAGVILFSGSLYLLAITQARWLGFLTPLGGLCFIIGWLTLLRR